MARLWQLRPRPAKDVRDTLSELSTAVAEIRWLREESHRKQQRADEEWAREQRERRQSDVQGREGT